jgi:hypothetical protein
MASTEDEPTGAIDMAKTVPVDAIVVPVAPVAPVALGLATTVPVNSEPPTLFYQPPQRRRPKVPTLALYALCAGMASLLITLTALLHH